MRRLSTSCSFLIAAFSLASLPAQMGAQSDRPKASETPCCKSVISKGQPILQPGTLREPGQAPVKPWRMPRIPTDTPSANRKTWIGASPGSLPLAVVLQPDITQKYGTNSGVLQVYFGHRR